MELRGEFCIAQLSLRCEVTAQYATSEDERFYGLASLYPARGLRYRPRAKEIGVRIRLGLRRFTSLFQMLSSRSRDTFAKAGMATDTVKLFLQALQQSKLLSETEWKTVRAHARVGRKQAAEPEGAELEAGEPGAAKPVAATGSANELKQLVVKLIERKLLTPWQAAQLQKGQTGFVLGRYRLLYPIGKGGMGHVFKADTFDSDEVVAVKVMARKLTSNESLVSRFRREIKASSRLDSQHVVRTLDAGRVGKVDFMVMEFVNGDQIDDIANRLQRLPVGIACEIIRHAAIGLQHAFEEQMVHRDIKPANLIVNWGEEGRGTVKLMDMGLVLIMSEDETQQQMTRTGQVMGTPDYMSPEQGWDTTSVDIRGDIYSLGCSLFRLLTGTTPFTGTNPLQVLSQRLQRDAPSITAIDGHLPEEVAAIVNRMTKRDLDARYQTPIEVAEALKPFCEELTLDALEAVRTRGTAETQIPLQETKIAEQPKGLDEGDVTYKQFLNEVQKGTDIDLMNMSAATPVFLESEIPIVETAPASALDKTRQRRTKRKRASEQGVENREAGWKSAAIAGAIAAVLLAGVFIWVNRGNDGGGDANFNSGLNPARATEVIFTDNQAQPAVIGRLFQFQPDITVAHRSSEANLFYRLANSSDPGIAIDEETAEVSWLVPKSQAIKPIKLIIQAVSEQDGSETVLVSRDVNVEITLSAAAVSMRIPEADELLLIPGREFTTSVAVTSEFHESLKFQYVLMDSTSPSITLDEDSGQLSWVPDRSDIGRHSLQLSVMESVSKKEMDQQSVAVLVLPKLISDVMDAPDVLTAKPGEMFTHRLGRIGTGRRSNGSVRLVLELNADAPEGANIVPRENMFRWDVPDSASGIIETSFTGFVRTQFGNKQLRGSLPLKIRIEEAESSVVSMVPSEERLEPLRSEIREMYDRRISRARSNSEKIALGRELLIACYDAEASDSDFALLQVIETDLGEDGRSLGLQLEIAELKAARYGADELEAATVIIDSFNRRSVPASERDLLTEHFLRLALLAAEQDNMSFVETVLKHCRTLITRSATGTAEQLADDLKQASAAVEELLLERSSPDVQELTRQELTRLLSRWQFRPAFRESSTIRWFQSSGNAIPTSELQEMWQLEDDVITLDSVQLAALAGFVDGGLSTDRFAFRCQLMPGSNAAHIVAGLDPDVSPRPPGILISVGGATPGQIQSLSDGKVIAVPKSANLNSFLPTAPNEIELIVDGTRIILRLNGTMISQGILAKPMPGLVGLGADLKIANPKMKIRNARILAFPEP